MLLSNFAGLDAMTLEAQQKQDEVNATDLLIEAAEQAQRNKSSSNSVLYNVASRTYRVSLCVVGKISLPIHIL